MPLYEYRCNKCRKRVTILVQGFTGSASGSCPGCGSADLQRLFSTFAIGKTDGDVYDEILSDTKLVKGLQSGDHNALMEWSKRMDNGGANVPKYDEVVERIHAGEMPPTWSEKDAPLKDKS